MNAEQQAFYEAVMDLERGQTPRTIVLNAPGGTGKTYTIKRIMSARDDAVVLAPTHKAVSLFYKEGVPARTIHSFLNATREINPEDGEIYFVFGMKGKCDENVIIIDEASMVSEKMYELLVGLEKHIVFVGDQCQLPPVKELTSPVFARRADLKFTFTINMRVNRNPDSISAMYLAKFRKGVDYPKVHIRVEKKTEDFMLDVFRKNDDVVMLAWSNAQVHHWNVKIRCALFNTTPQDLQAVYVNERLLFSGYRCVDGKKYFSNDEIQVEQLRIITEFVEYQTGRCTHQTNPDRITSCSSCGISGRLRTGHEIEFFEITDQRGVRWLRPRTHLKQLQDLIADFKKHCKHMKDLDLWREFYGFRDLYNADIIYPYAMTVHKAQGSQWEFVNVDIDNIRTNHKIEERCRMEYTAVSRFSKMLFFIQRDEVNSVGFKKNSYSK